MFSKVTKTAASANSCRVMEAETIQKNAASLKSQRVGINCHLFAAFVLVLYLGMGSAVAQEQTDSVETSDPGVEINGVIWATRNVDAPGTFAASLESSGKFYTWDEAQTACPKGWRLPTSDEVQSLSKKNPLFAGGGNPKNIMDKYAKWIVENGVEGRLFGKEPNQMFLPAAGFVNSKGDFNGEFGAYWTSSSFAEVKTDKSGTITIKKHISPEDADKVYFLSFSKKPLSVGQFGASKSARYCVRCVAESE